VQVCQARPLDAAGRAQVEAHGYLAYRWARRFLRYRARGMPPEDVIAEAMYGLTYAAGMYDPSRHVPFGAYATLVVRHRLERAVINWRRSGRHLPMTLGSCTGDEVWEAEDSRPTPDFANRASAHEMCERIRRVMPARSYQILRLYYSEGLTFEEIGSRFGLSRERIRQVMVQAIKKARQYFPNGVA
jgi:RNA polymerase sigma factor (sigma-70 family)